MAAQGGSATAPGPNEVNERTALLSKSGGVPVLYHASDAQSQPTLNAIETTVGRDGISHAEVEAGSSTDGSRTPIADAEDGPVKPAPLSPLRIILLVSALNIHSTD